jgi:hypothetical protein
VCVLDEPPAFRRFFIGRRDLRALLFASTHSFEFQTIEKLKNQKEKKDIRQLRSSTGDAMSKIVNCPQGRCTACRRPALRRYQPDHRLTIRESFTMNRIAKILTATALACAVLVPALAEAHSHRVCHFDHHHHRVCRWVR